MEKENTPENNHEDSLVVFLRDLANSIERDELIPKQLQSIGDFFMSYKFQEQAIKDGDVHLNESFLDRENFIKFLIMGWYVYGMLSRNKKL